MDGGSWRWGGGRESSVLYCCIRSSPCFSCSENWFGNSPINIDEAMTNGNYGLTGQKLPLGKFYSITISLVLRRKVNCVVGFSEECCPFFIQYIYFQSDSSASIQNDVECPAKAKQPRQRVACLRAAFKILIKQRQKESV